MTIERSVIGIERGMNLASQCSVNRSSFCTWLNHYEFLYIGVRNAQKRDSKSRRGEMLTKTL